jgi:hypothetical protein
MLPVDVIAKILRIDKSLYHLSRIVSKNIRNAALHDILQHEMLEPIHAIEIKNLEEPYTIIENFTSVLFDDEGFSKKITKHVKSYLGTRILHDSRHYYCQSEYRYDHYDCKTKFVAAIFGKKGVIMERFRSYSDGNNTITLILYLFIK